MAVYMYNTNCGAGKIYIQDEDNVTYSLSAQASTNTPYMYLLTPGTYVVTGLSDNCSILYSNWSALIENSSPQDSPITLASGGSGYFCIKKESPAINTIVQGPYFVYNTTGGYSSKARMVVTNVGVEETLELETCDVYALDFTISSNYNTLDSNGEIVLFAYYIKYGSYKIISISTGYVSINGSIFVVGDTISISGDGYITFNN